MLKQLELIGFKSFADKTAFEFHQGITGVVGPNGSGKSNVVDSIKWILGDQSAKSMRGKEMTDVIFNGSSSRKGNAFAEATLTFDNHSGFLPIEATEVSVGRRLWRNGDSEYLVNNNVARLKDVRNLFIGTGAGASTYCIIEQGRVDQILQGNPTARRAVFEEAAGISRFKSRKAEALRKLDRVDQNLLRLTDIVDEVDSQLNSVRNQAQKAAKYREVSGELRELWVGLAADDYRNLNSRLIHVQDAEQTRATEIADLNAAQQQLEARLSSLDGEITQVDDQLRIYERLSADVRQTIASHNATIRHESSRRTEIESDIIRLRRQRAMMESRYEEALSELERTKTVLDNYENEHEGLSGRLATHETRIRELTESIARGREFVEDAREGLLERMREHTSFDSELTGLRSRFHSTNSSHQRSNSRRLEFASRIASCLNLVQQQSVSVDDSKSELEKAEAIVNRIQNDRVSKQEEQLEAQQKVAELRERRSGWQARKSVLEDLEERQEGIGIGVREILRRSRLNDYPPWNSIIGSVADLLDVDLDHAALMEVALGNRAQLLVLSEMEPLIEYLNSGRCAITGRVGFVAIGHSSIQEMDGVLDSDGPGTWETRPARGIVDLSDEEGVVDRADQLARGTEVSVRLAKHLLADTWIVRTLQDALRMAKGRGAGCRFVTLQGELLDANGILFAGTVRSETAVVSRKSELRRLRNDLDRIEEQIAREERDLTRLADSVTTYDVELVEAQTQVRNRSATLTQVQTELADREREHLQLKQEEDSIAGELLRLVAEAGELQSSVKLMESQLVDSQSQMDTLKTNIDRTDAETSERERELQKALQLRTQEQLEVAKHEERLSNLRADFSRLETDVEQRSQQLEEALRRFEDAEIQHKRLTMNVLNTRALLAELYLEDDQHQRFAIVESSKKDKVRKHRARVLAEETDVRKHRRSLSDIHHELKMESRETSRELDAIQERISEEYQIELSEAVAEGVSALTVWKTRLAKSNKRGKGSKKSRKAVEPIDDSANTGGTDTADSDGNQNAGFLLDASLGEDGNISVPTDEQLSDSDDYESEQYDEADAEPEEPEIDFAEVRDDIEAEVNRYRRRIKKMGNVNSDSLDNLDELESRFEHMNSQLQDLLEAKTSLEEIVRRINVESRRMFTETFDSIRGHFKDLFRKLFGGGEGDMVLEDPEDILECGIDIVARPPGKELRSISLLSGGEKTLTAVAMSLAIFKSRPSPFCILDEVDAALDDANIDRFINVLRMFADSTQFIMITHRKPTMQVADLLYGVTMEESGVSKRLAVKFDEVAEDGSFKNSDKDDDQRQAAA